MVYGIFVMVVCGSMHVDMLVTGKMNEGEFKGTHFFFLDTIAQVANPFWLVSPYTTMVSPCPFVHHCMITGWTVYLTTT